MKYLIFDYDMQITYSEAVSKCNFTIKCIPQNTARQLIGKVDIDLFPKTSYSWGVDGLKNVQIYGSNEKKHNTFCFHINGYAKTGMTAYEEVADENQAMIFAHPHGLNVAGKHITEYFRKIRPQIPAEEDTLSVAVKIMHRLYEDYSYMPGITNVNTTAEEALALGRGVCQDYAHIFISLLHLAGITSRYVTGFMLGEGASHAWVEVLYNGMWYGLDPTNDKHVLDDYIKIGVGRDAGDCMINRGIMHGGGLHTQEIKVIVKEIEE